jgi:protein-L-isoaspartate(D-aspartate) O-methyltransferase
MFNTDEKYSRLRKLMVETQISTRDIKNKQILDAMLKVERHLFIPKKLRREAYKDHPVPIGYNQTISQPYIVAYMSEKLDIQAKHKVLEIGTGCGYQTAILCELAKQVYTVELVEELAVRAGKILHGLNYNNFKLKIDDAHQGWKEHAPYHRIIVTCAPSHIPEQLMEQLAENGKMIIPYGQKFSQELVLIKKQGGKLTQKHILPVRFVPMKNKFGTEY